MQRWSKIHIYSQVSVTVRAKLFHFPYSVDISHPMPPTFWLTVSGLGMSLSLRNILEKDLLLWLKCKSHSYFHNMIKKFLKIFGTAIGLTMFSSYRLVMYRPYPRNFHDLCQSTLWRACHGCDSLYAASTRELFRSNSRLFSFYALNYLAFDEQSESTIYTT